MNYGEPVFDRPACSAAIVADKHWVWQAVVHRGEKNGPMLRMSNTSPQQRTRENKVRVVRSGGGDGDSWDTTKGEVSTGWYDGLRDNRLRRSDHTHDRAAGADHSLLPSYAPFFTADTFLS